ncbi:MAG TPA: PQQ-binding-like beta-propeller repeat protein, partial [Baekduia sp.]|nr:PQQ-binding-like beta-propeller repeat protein [Baekduia sp.]
SAAWPARASAWWPNDDADWPMAAHDLAGTRSTPLGVRGIASAAPGVRWRVPLAGGVPGAAAVVGRTVVAASLGGEVVAVDLRSGRERWRVATGQRFFGGPAVAEGRVVVASDRVTALDLRSGRVVWSAPPLAAGGSDDYFWARRRSPGRSCWSGRGPARRSRGRGGG